MVRHIKSMFLLGCVLFSAAAMAQSACTKNANGQITDTGNVVCYAQPQDYQVTIYKIGLCTAPVSATTTSAINYSNCSLVYNNPNGVTTSIIKGQMSPLDGGVTMPPAGTYNYAVIEMAPTFTVKAGNTFASNIIGTGGGSGQFCWSLNGTVYTYQNHASLAAACGAAMGTPASTTTYMNGINGSATFVYSSTVNGTPINAYLVSSDYKLPASGLPNNSNGIYRMVGVANTTNTVTSNTRNFNVAFDVSNGATLTLFTAPEQRIDNYTIGPFAPIFTLQ